MPPPPRRAIRRRLRRASTSPRPPSSAWRPLRERAHRRLRHTTPAPARTPRACGSLPHLLGYEPFPAHHVLGQPRPVGDDLARIDLREEVGREAIERQRAAERVAERLPGLAPRVE